MEPEARTVLEVVSCAPDKSLRIRVVVPASLRLSLLTSPLAPAVASPDWGIFIMVPELPPPEDIAPWLKSVEVWAKAVVLRNATAKPRAILFIRPSPSLKN